MGRRKENEGKGDVREHVLRLGVLGQSAGSGLKPVSPYRDFQAVLLM